ncbi:MAG: DNA repair protein RadC [Bacteroidota bacterium]
MNKKSVGNWSEMDRPREKLIRNGLSTLSVAELIAILIRTGTKEKNAVAISQELLAAYQNNLASLSRLTIKELSKIKGLGAVKAISILAALELGRRRREYDISGEKIKSSKDAMAQMHPLLADLPYEEFWIILLNRANKIISKKKVSMGGTSGTVVDPKIIFKEAIQATCSNIIAVHNHPSGNTEPSQADKELTNKLKLGANHLDIQLLDHLIIAGNDYYSFADEGEL